MDPDDDAITHLIHRFSNGDRGAADTLVRRILPQLRKIAGQQLRQERFPPPVSTTELIHEVWLNNLGRGGWQVKDRHHFYAIAGRAMRQVLVELARRRLSQRRGGGFGIVSVACLTDHETPVTATAEQIILIDQLMERLSESHPESAQIVDLHYFVGWTFEEISANTGLSPRRVRYLWDKGRNSLASQLR